MANSETKQDIDFLPQFYREKSQQRQRKASRYAIVAAFGLLLIAAALWQLQLKWYVQRQVEELRPLVVQTENSAKLLAVAQQDLTRTESEAKLFAYLAHPWPTTQLLKAATMELPAEVTLTQLSIELPKEVFAPEGFGRRPPVADAEVDTAPLAAPLQDLATLRSGMGRARPVIRLHGKTSSAAAIHRYLDLVAQSPLIERAELENFAADAGSTGDDDQTASGGRFTFEATLTVRPPHGHPLRKSVENSDQQQLVQGNHS